VSSGSSERGWGGAATATTFVIVRHGATDHSLDKRFSGGLTGADPALNETGIAQVEATAAWLAIAGVEADALVSSPVRRTRESAAILAERLGVARDDDEPGIAEMDFGTWDGSTFAQIQASTPDDLTAWLGDHSVPAGGGESMQQVQERVLAARDRLLEAYAGRTVVLVSHVTPIKVLVADAVGAPLDAIYRMELAPATVTTIAYYADRGAVRASLRLFNGGPLTPAAPSSVE
jgi:broad specificity phosphatase PhoE